MAKVHERNIGFSRRKVLEPSPAFGQHFECSLLWRVLDHGIIIRSVGRLRLDLRWDIWPRLFCKPQSVQLPCACRWRYAVSQLSGNFFNRYPGAPITRQNLDALWRPGKWLLLLLHFGLHAGYEERTQKPASPLPFSMGNRRYNRNEQAPVPVLLGEGHVGGAGTGLPSGTGYR